MLRFALFVLLISSAVYSSPPTILLIHSYGSQFSQLNSVINAFQGIFSFTLFDVSSSSLPTLNQMLTYNATLLTFGWASIYNRNALATLLYQYVNKGGPLVITMDAFGNSTGYTLSLGPNFPDEYYAIVPAPNYSAFGDSTMQVLDSSSPILAGVSSFDGGTCSDRGGQWSGDGHQVAQWSDGKPLIGTKIIGNTRRVDLAFFIVPSPTYFCGWNPSTGGWTIIQNALNWVVQKEHLCYQFNGCRSCTSSSFGQCEWCLNTGQCTPIDFSCPNRIYRSRDCPGIECYPNGQCSTCLSTSNENQCVWCLDNHTCMNTNATCKGEISNSQFCNSKIGIN